MHVKQTTGPGTTKSDSREGRGSESEKRGELKGDAEKENEGGPRIQETTQEGALVLVAEKRHPRPGTGARKWGQIDGVTKGHSHVGVTTVSGIKGPCVQQ